MANTLSRSWEQLYQEAVDEADVNNLTRRVHVAEAAMFYRWQELAESKLTAEQREHQRLQEASEGLLRIKTEKLKWPGLDFATVQQ
jgi:phage terminase Nu1 subunit (DNA packaging protein)